MDKSIVRYVPARLKAHVTAAYREDGALVVEFDEHVYDSVMETASEASGYATLFADTVSELKQMLSLCELC